MLRSGDLQVMPLKVALGASSIDSFISNIAFVDGGAILAVKREERPMATAAMMTVPPSREEVELARASGQRLAPLARLSRPLTLRVRDAGQEETIELPAGAVKLLVEILEDMASG